MSFLRKLFGSQNPHGETTESLIPDLSYRSPDVAKCKAAVDRFTEAYPLIAAMGIGIFVDAPPPEVVKIFKERDRLDEQLSIAKKAEENIRTRVALKLGELRDLTAVQPLIAALKDEYAAVRKSAAETLGNIGDTRAIVPLTELAQKDSDEDIRKAAQDAMERIQKADI